MAEIWNHRAAARAPRGYVASLSPEGQVDKVISDIKNLKDGGDLYNWSASSRRELTSAIKIPFQIGTDTKSIVYIPSTLR